MEAEISVAEAAAGKTVEVAYELVDVCEHCHGNGAEPGTPIETCPTCNGAGRATCFGTRWRRAEVEGGADIRYIQEMLGHVELSTTQIYTQVSIRKLQAVHALTHPTAKLERRPAAEAEDAGEVRLAPCRRRRR